MTEYKLTDIVKEYCIEGGDYNFNRAMRYKSFGTSTLRELNIDFTAVPESIQLFPNDEGIADLPCNFLNYVSISVVGRDGILYGMTENPNIDLTRYYNKCGELTRVNQFTTQTAINDGALVAGDFWGATNPTYFANHYSSGEFTGGYYSKGSHNRAGGYKIDYKNKKIYFNEIRCAIGFIVMEFTTDIKSENEDYYIHPFIVDTIKTGIYWRSIRQDRNFSLGDKQLAENTFQTARKRSIGRFNHGTYDEWISAIRKTNKAVNKW